jgi:DNA-directed RNA polymerase subunit RPC12/RpoP
MECPRCGKDMGTRTQRYKFKTSERPNIKCPYCQFNVRKCYSCQIDKIHNKGRKLCLKCNLKHTQSERATPSYESEYEFMRNYPEPENLYYHNAYFKFNGSKYYPDFYDYKRDVFIEVVLNPDSYRMNYNRTKQFIKFYPNIGYEVRYPNGQVVPEFINEFVKPGAPIQAKMD